MHIDPVCCAQAAWVREAAPSIFPARSKLHAGKLEDAIDGQEHDQLAIDVAQLAAIVMDVADLLGFEALELRCGLAGREPGYVVALKTAVQTASAEVRDRVFEATQHVMERQQRPAPELDDDSLLGRREDCALRRLRSRRIGVGGAPAALVDGLGPQAVAGDKDAATFFRRLESGSKTRRRAGAAVKDTCLRASSP
jgi:hypothetical protein